MAGTPSTPGGQGRHWIVLLALCALALCAPAAHARTRYAKRDVCPPSPLDLPRCQSQVVVDKLTGRVVHPTPRRPAAIEHRGEAPEGPRSERSPTASQSVFPPAFGTPAFLQEAYDLGPFSASQGEGATIALVELGGDPEAEADLAHYRSYFGLPPCTSANGCFRSVDRYGQPDQPGSVTYENVLETSLDLDAASALCPHCRLLLVDGEGGLAAAQAMAVQLGATVVSDSWFWEAPEAIYEQFDFPGVATVASSGDDGYFSRSESSAYPVPTTLPNTTSAGGTDLLRPPSSGVRSLRGYTETAWQGSGSSCDPAIARPPWQPALGCPGRATADASAEGGTPIYVYTTAGGGWTLVGGTSLSAPLIAAFYALTRAPAQNPSWIYQSAAALNDVTEGANGSCAPAYLCNAGPEYDGPTGIGSISGSAARGAPGIAGPGMLNGSYLRAAIYSPEADAVSASLQGGVYANGLATSYRWQYGLSVLEHETEAVALPPSCSVGLASATLTELEPEREYRYRLVADNALGTSYGFTYTLDTSPDELPAPEPAFPAPAPTACPSPSPLPNVPDPVRPKKAVPQRRPSKLKVRRARVARGVLVLALSCRGEDPAGCRIRIAIRGHRHTRTLYRRLRVHRVLRIRLGSRFLSANRLLVTTYLRQRDGVYRRADRRRLAVR